VIRKLCKASGRQCTKGGHERVPPNCPPTPITGVKSSCHGSPSLATPDDDKANWPLNRSQLPAVLGKVFFSLYLWAGSSPDRTALVVSSCELQHHIGSLRHVTLGITVFHMSYRYPTGFTHFYHSSPPNWMWDRLSRG
jgi:hypothetical protein